MPDAALNELVSTTRGEVTIDSGSTYDGVRPVLIHISKREARYRISDEGAAVDAAAPAGAVTYPDHIDFGEHSVNVTGQGVVWLPAVTPSDERLAAVCELVAKGSVALYEHLLELD